MKYKHLAFTPPPHIKSKPLISKAVSSLCLYLATLFKYPHHFSCIMRCNMHLHIRQLGINIQRLPNLFSGHPFGLTAINELTRTTCPSSPVQPNYLSNPFITQ